MATALAALAAPPAWAGSAASLSEVEFNSDFLQGGGGGKVDLARFANGNPVLPGDYLVDLDLNGQWISRVKVRFVTQPGRDSAEPCIDGPILAKLRLAASQIPAPQIPAPQIPAPMRADLASHGCADLRGLAKDVAIDFDQSTLRLSLSIPQAMLDRRPRGYVDPEFWDKGVPSATFSYDANVFRADGAGGATTSVYAGFTGGLNLGSWHFRQRSSLSGVDGAWHFQNVAAYLQHDLPRLKASLTLGDTFTDGAVFDSFGFRGISVATDDRMQPESQQGYAPVVRGIAKSNARVRISQNGNLLLETTVPPGPFEINDLNPTGYGGDLLVTVLEADGSQESFTVTYASLVQLLRPRTWRFNVAAGELTSAGAGSGDRFFQGAVQYGLTNDVTGYAGAAVAPGYASGLIGVALNTPVGAIALDATLAQARIAAGDPDQGYSVRLSYSKVVPGILTNISVAAYRHSSGGYWSMRDAMDAREAGRRGLDPRSIQRQRNRFQVNVSQNLGKGYGSLYLSGSATSYWHGSGSVIQLQAGYNNVARLGKFDLNYGLSYARQHDEATGKANDRLLLTLSAALGEKTDAPRLTMNLARSEIDGRSQASGQVSLNGTFGAEAEYSYNANAIIMPGANSASLGGAYRARFATLSASAGKGDHFTQFSLGASGGLVIHPGGVTLANQLGDTIGIVAAHDAKGAGVSSGYGARIDGAGYAVIPNLMPYRLNDVVVDPRGSPLDIEMKTTSQQVAPRANTVVMLKFETVSGRAVMMNARLPDGTPVPFGASVRDAGQAEVGISGQDGQIFLRGIPETGILQVSWNDQAQGGCRLDYRLPAPSRDNAAMLKLETVCTPMQEGILARQTPPHIDFLPI